MWCVSHVLCQAGDPFVQTDLLANAHCTGLLVCVKASLTSGTISIREPYQNSLGYPGVAPSHGEHAPLVPQGQYLHALQQVMDGVDVGVDLLETLDVGLGAS